MREEVKQAIQKDIKGNKVMLYMKGTPEAPQCGFSAQIVKILNHFKVGFGSKDILADEELRQGVKEFSEWPTIPQLYINGQFIGGCDIVTEMAKDGQLEKLLKSSGSPS